MATHFKKIDTGIFLSSLVVVVVVEVWLVWLVHRWGSTLYFLGGARTVEILCLVGLFTWKGGGVAALGFPSGRWKAGVVRGCTWAAAFAIAAGLAWGALLFFGLKPMDMIRTPLPPSIHHRLVFLFVGGLIAPIAEEIVFRGIIYGYLRRWGMAVALIGSTLLFVTAHVGRGIPVTQSIGGLVFAIAYEKEKTLMVPVIIHILGNSAIFILSWVL